jgi:7-carboxy-7-deazaguanine synthase
VYCDTSYAFSGGENQSLDDILNMVRGYQVRHVCVTGGEPLAQAACLILLKSLADTGYEVSIETSGALDVSKVDPRVVKVVDLKTPSSGEAHRNLYSNMYGLLAHDQVKFVIMNDEDYRWSVEQLKKYHLAERCEVLFSPAMGLQSPTELADKILADRLPVRFQLQLHKLLWGDLPGK